MNVSLTPELEQLVQDRVASGMYTSASEVVREALRLMKEQDQVRQLRLDELRREIAVGIDQADAGRVVEVDAASHKRRVRERLQGAR